MKIKLVSKVGDDTIADTLLENLNKAGVDTTYVFRAPNTTTSVTTVIVDSSEHTRTCLHTLGTCGELTADETRVVMDKLLTDGSVIHVHSDGRHAEAALLLAREARLRNIPLSVDIEKDRHSIEVDWLLKNSTLLFTNSNQMGDYLARLERQYMESSPQKSPWKDSPAIGKAANLSQAGLNVYLKALGPSAFLTRWYPMPGKEIVITQGSRGALCMRCHSITKEDDYENLDSRNDVSIAYNADDDFIDILQNTATRDAIPTSLRCGTWVSGRKLGGVGAQSALPTANDVHDCLGSTMQEVAASLRHTPRKFVVRFLSFFLCHSPNTTTMNGGPKDNANPVVKAVDNRQSARAKKRRPLGWDELQRISADPIATVSIDDPNTWTTEHLQPQVEIKRTPEDIAVMQALADVSAMTGGKGVSLLTRAGIVIPSRDQIAWQPSFDHSDLMATKPDDIEMDEQSFDEYERDPLESDEVFDIIRNIQDPEHPLTLEQLGVVSREQIVVQDLLDVPMNERNSSSSSSKSVSSLHVRFTPTVPHCSMATLIGLAIQVKLHRSLPRRFKVKISIEPGTHQSETAVNKQLQDKERVCAALENPHLLKIVNKCILDGMESTM
ncbi:hypothetical protein MPSEU_000956300 [Mayamaea pseudoterrestris]|nr:hypothetical protein MPSEU_000956300 [Mayamaea pseudoterrestris]